MKNLMKKYIKTGIQVGPSIEILEGLSVGDEVLVESLSFDKSKKSESENPFLPKMPKKNNKK